MAPTLTTCSWRAEEVFTGPDGATDFILKGQKTFVAIPDWFFHQGGAKHYVETFLDNLYRVREEEEQRAADASRGAAPVHSTRSTTRADVADDAMDVEAEAGADAYGEKNKVRTLAEKKAYVRGLAKWLLAKPAKKYGFEPEGGFPSWEDRETITYAQLDEALKKFADAIDNKLVDGVVRGDSHDFLAFLAEPLEFEPEAICWKMSTNRNSANEPTKASGRTTWESCTDRVNVVAYLAAKNADGLVDLAAYKAAGEFLDAIMPPKKLMNFDRMLATVFPSWNEEVPPTVLKEWLGRDPTKEDRKTPGFSANSVLRGAAIKQVLVAAATPRPSSVRRTSLLRGRFDLRTGALAPPLAEPRGRGQARLQAPRQVRVLRRAPREAVRAPRRGYRAHGHGLDRRSQVRPAH